MGIKALKTEIQEFNPRRSLICAAFVFAGAWLLSLAIPPGTESLGAWSLIPAFFLIVYIFITKRILEALTLASVVGFLMTARQFAEGSGVESFFAAPGTMLSSFSDSLLTVMMGEDMAWLLIVCGVMGSIISLIERAGGAFAFGDWVARRTKTRKGVLLWTWLLGVIIFIDDYLNSLTVGSCMAPVTDRKKVSREFLAYIVDSTAAPLCVLIPISTWAVFCGELLETNGWAPSGEGLRYFIQTIPFSFYGWVAALVVPLVILGIIPTFGPMKKAEERVANGGPLAPPESDKIDIKGGIELEIPKRPKILNFIIPIVILVVATCVADLDMQIGVLITMAAMFVLYLSQKLMTAEEFADVAVQGLKNMILPLLMMALTFLFAAVNETIGFTAYVIESATSMMTPALTPFIVFLVLAFTEFITGTNWGMYIVALPIVIPLAQNLDVNMPLAVSAVLSAGVFGSHVCFYSDATILTSAATGCNNFRHAITQAPFGLLAAGITAVLYLVVGAVVA